jgi:16S rRNA (adenine(1408)-N(1))-methyltransferase
LAARAERLVIDVGTGDGRAVLELAHRHPLWLVVGLDANAAGMAEVSRRATSRRERGGTPNALFAVAAAETPPTELRGRADLVTIAFPWGSLLRGVLGADGKVTAGVTSLLCPGGDVRILFSVEARDRMAIGPFDDAARECAIAAWSDYGVAVQELRPATSAEIGGTRSTWARRLSTDPTRRTWLLIGRSR